MRRTLYEQLYVRALAQEIAERRRWADLTQPQLAARIGAHASSISRYESGAQDIPSGRLAAIADAVGVPLSSLVAICAARADAARLLHERITRERANRRAAAAGTRDRAAPAHGRDSRSGSSATTSRLSR